MRQRQSLSFHWILHQESLYKAVLDLKHMVDPILSVVNTIRARALHHHQFKSFLRDMEAENDLPQWGKVVQIRQSDKESLALQNKISYFWTQRRYLETLLLKQDLRNRDMRRCLLLMYLRNWINWMWHSRERMWIYVKLVKAKLDLFARQPSTTKTIFVISFY